jgi:hypothetical protein
MRFKSRLQRLEKRVPERQKPSANWSLLTMSELLRLCDAWERQTLTQEEFARWVHVAHDREAAGMTPQEVPDRLGALEKERNGGRVSLEAAVAKRLGVDLYRHFYERFDTIDLNSEEVERLRVAIETANTIAELNPLAELISRLWFNSKPMTIESFADLILEGNVPNSPRV